MRAVWMVERGWYASAASLMALRSTMSASRFGMAGLVVEVGQFAVVLGGELKAVAFAEVHPGGDEREPFGDFVHHVGDAGRVRPPRDGQHAEVFRIIEDLLGCQRFGDDGGH